MLDLQQIQNMALFHSEINNSQYQTMELSVQNNQLLNEQHNCFQSSTTVITQPHVWAKQPEDGCV